MNFAERPVKPCFKSSSIVAAARVFEVCGLAASRRCAAGITGRPASCRAGRLLLAGGCRYDCNANLDASFVRRYLCIFILYQFSDFSKDARASFSTSLSFGNRCVGFLAVVAAKTHLRCLTPTRSSSWPDLQGLE